MDAYSSGSYVVLLLLKTETVIDVGKLGCYTFSPGYYLYVGSAMRGLQARILRHLGTKKKRHWHVDYLREHTEPVEAWIMPSAERRECDWAQSVAAIPGAQRPIRGFGSSDCPCASHLFYFADRPTRIDLLKAAATGEPLLTIWVGDHQ